MLLQDMLLNEGMDNITSAAELEPLNAHLKQLTHESQGAGAFKVFRS